MIWYMNKKISPFGKENLVKAKIKNHLKLYLKSIETEKEHGRINHYASSE